jgi:hypothetical protein
MGWLTERQRHGGIDRVEVPGAGALWLCGKHLIAPDPEGTLSAVGAAGVVCLNERHELVDRYPGYCEWLGSDRRALWSPVPDLGVTSPEAMTDLVVETRRRLDDGDLVVHCGAGMGRAGTVAVGVLIAAGLDAASALAVIAAARPGAGPESGAQADLVARWSGQPPK